MKTNELKKGRKIRLRNGWEAELADNMRGNTRMAKVYGHFTETGSVYSHDIMHYRSDADTGWLPVEHTPTQLKLKKEADTFFGGRV